MFAAIEIMYGLHGAAAAALHAMFIAINKTHPTSSKHLAVDKAHTMGLETSA